MRIYTNEGHDVESPEEFKQAVKSHGGIPWVKVYISKVDNKVSAQRPIDNIGQFNNFCFTLAGLRVWKACSKEEGKLLDLNQERQSYTTYIQRGAWSSG